MTTAQQSDVFRSAWEGRAAGRDPAWLLALREQAFSAFAAKGLPTTRDEDWRFTSLVPLAATPFVPASAFDATQAGLEAAGLVALPGPRVVFVNGRFHAELSRSAGAVVRPLREVLRGDAGVLDGRVGVAGNAFSALNTALFEDGALVEIPEGAVLPEPVHLVFYSAADAAPTMAHPRVVVRAGRGSQAVLVESHVGRGVYLTNAVTTLELAAGARLEHVKLQSESEQAFHVASVSATLARDAFLAQHHVSFGSRLARADIGARLEDAGAEARLLGLFHADGERTTDSHTRLDHATPRATSHELYKGVLDGRGRGVFHGRIVVRPDAQKTAAYQSNKNLLLSKQALVQSTPQLEIFADDVKCKHGSTTGQLDETALFYLRSRGIGEAEARGVLTYAFASEVVKTLPHAGLRSAVTQALQRRLGGVRELMQAAS
jgi:Fe-S cluster assembly protein SufD